jgi:hypothetical protein
MTEYFSSEGGTKGKERKGKERKGKERKGKERGGALKSLFPISY